MNLPTKITIARIALIPLMIVFFCLREVFEYSFILVTTVFVVASCTDFIDGHIARSRNMVTDLGKFLDPIADKILVAAGLVMIIADGVLNVYVSVIGTIIILAREFIIGVFRQIAATKSCVMAADKLGKLKTVFTLIAISVLLLSPMAKMSGGWYIAGQVFLIAGFAAFLVAVVLTIWSGINYIVKNKGVLKEDKQEGKNE